MKDLERKAFLLAMDAHQHQKYGSEPYLVHLFDVTSIIRAFDSSAEKEIAAGWLHDILEDTTVNYSAIIQRLGMSKEATEVADIVYDVTDELGKNRKERAARTIPKIAASRSATLVKLADYIANTTDSIRAMPDLMQMHQKSFKAFEDACRKNYPEFEPLWEMLVEFLKTDVTPCKKTTFHSV